MMIVEKFLKSLATQGITLWTEGDKLRYRAPKNVVTSALLTQLKAHKPEILQLLNEKGTYAPLSYGQQALWFIYQSEPESVAYNIPVPLGLHIERLDVSLLKHGLQALVERHAMLRTVFTTHEGKPLQKIRCYHQLDWEEIDASGWSDDELIEQVNERYHRPFDLENGPVFRASLFNRGMPVLFLCVHHIVCDDWSTQVMIDELRSLYWHSELPPPPSYLDYVHWQTDLLSQEGQKLADYWQKQLGDELPVLKLPTDHPRPPVLRLRGASHGFELSPELSHQLKTLARTEGVTLYNLLLAAFQVLLYRYTGQEDILVGSPTSASRSQADFAGTVGYFINQIVLRADLSGNPTFKAFMSQVRQTVLGGLAHQDYPFPLLVKQLQPPRDPSRSPLFQTFFVFQNMRFKGTTSTDEFEVFDIGQMEGQFDLILVMEEKETLVGTVKYNTDLFKGETIVRMVKHFQVLLSSIIVNPAEPISALPILSETERQQLLVTWNNTRQAYSEDKCIHQLFENRVKQTPDAVALVFASVKSKAGKKVSLTYRELNARSNQLAHYLMTKGVCPEILVGLLLERSVEMVIGLLAILKAGGVYVPLDPKHPQARLHFMLENAQIKVLLTQTHLASQLKMDDVSLIYLDGQYQGSEENPASGVHPENLAYIIYTSGSTGQPKGVMIAHRSVCNLAEAQIRAFDVTPESRVLQFASLNFDASISEIMMALCAGASLYLARSEDLLPGPTLKQLLQEQAISHVTLTPSALAVLSPNGLSTLQSLIVAGEACSADLVMQWSKGRRFFNAYGPTENTVCATIMECTTDAPPPIGKPMDNIQIYILDHYLQPVPIGVPGELHIGGVGLARGYLNRPDLTKEKFIHTQDSRLYKTGDLARYLPDGNIEFLGRIDNQVKLRGYRIELGEIEALLKKHLGVQNAVVIARGEEASKQLIAYWVSNENIKADDLRRYLAEKLPEYMIPAAFMPLKVIPITPNGKIDYRALPAPQLSNADFVPPREPLEAQLVEIWESILNVRPIGVRDDFFELGGHSLLAVRLLSQIEQQLGKNVSLRTLLQGTTIEQLTRLLSQGSETWSPLIPIQPTGNLPPFFCIHPISGNVLCYRDLARYLGQNQPFYGLQAQGLDGEQEILTQIEVMATRYIEAIKTVQPQGPYYLGGWSLGGLIAFEIAQQCYAQGDSVALLALIDSYLHKDFDESTLLSDFVNDLSGLSGKSLPGVSNDQQDSDDQLGRILKQAIMADVLPADVELQHLHRLWQVFKANFQAMSRYIPRPYPEQIVLFRASEHQTGEASGWQDLATGGLEIQWIQGDHYTLIQEPQVQILAEYLRGYLSKRNNT
jgi:amino acid adenylation domain-containing protein